MGHKARTDTNEGDRTAAWREADAAATRNATAPFRPPGESGIAGGETASDLSTKKRKKAKQMGKKMKKAAAKWAKKNANNGGDISTTTMLEVLRQSQVRGGANTLVDPDRNTTTTVGDAAVLEKELANLLLRKAVATGYDAQAIAARLQVVGDELTLAKLRLFNAGLL